MRIQLVEVSKRHTGGHDCFWQNEARRQGNITQHGRVVERVQPYYDGVMVRCAIGVHFVERILCGGFEGCIVIQNIRLIRVDVPICRRR